MDTVGMRLVLVDKFLQTACSRLHAKYVYRVLQTKKTELLSSVQECQEFINLETMNAENFVRCSLRD